MEQMQVISMREVQRNYKKIFRQALLTKKPVVLGVRGKPQAVVLDMQTFEELKRASEKTREKTWQEIKSTLDRLAKSGRQNVVLSELVIRDRQNH